MGRSSEQCSLHKEYDAELSPLGERVVELLGDESLQNTAGINMWLGTNAFDFFSEAGQKWQSEHWM